MNRQALSRRFKRWLPVSLGLDLVSEPGRWVFLQGGFHPSVVAHGKLSPQESWAGLVSRLALIHPTVVAAGASSGGIYFQPMALPFKDRRKARAVLAFELEPKLPEPIEGLLTDILMYEGGGLGLAARPNLFEAERKQLEQDGLSPRALEPDLLSAARAWMLSQAPEVFSGQTTALLLIQPRQIGMVWFQQGGIRWMGSFLGGALALQSSDNKAFSLLKLAFKRLSQDKSVDVAFCGEAAKKPAVLEALSGILEFDAPAETWKPFGLDAEYAVAWGAAYRGLDRSAPLSVSLFSSEPESQPFWSSGRRKLAALLGGVTFVLGATDFYLQLEFKQQKLQALESQIHQMFRQVDPLSSKIVNAPAQLQTKIEEMERKVKLFPDPEHDAAHPLVVLLALSEVIPKEKNLTLSAYQQSGNLLHLEGEINGLGALSSFQSALLALPLIERVDLGPTRKTVAEDRLGFSIDLTLREQQ